MSGFGKKAELCPDQALRIERFYRSGEGGFDQWLVYHVFAWFTVALKKERIQGDGADPSHQVLLKVFPGCLYIALFLVE